MSDSSPSEARPPQLTLAGVMVTGASVLLLLASFQQLAGLDSLAARQPMERLATGFGMTLGQMQHTMRGALVVCLAVTAVLGVFVVRKHHGARLTLSILAVPVVVLSLLTPTYLLGFLLAGGIVTLWTGPTGDWFAGRPVRKPPERAERPERREPPADPPAPGPPAYQLPPPTTTPSGQPPATAGYGEARVVAAPAPVPAPAPLAPVATTAVDVHRRPGQVLAACVLTWVFAGIVAAGCLIILLSLAVARDQLVDAMLAKPQVRDAVSSPSDLVPTLVVRSLFLLAWSVLAIVLAGFAFRRHGWARVALAVSAAFALLAGMEALPLALLHQVACVAAFVLLFAPASRDWYAARDRHPTPPAAPPGPTYGPPPTQPPPPSGKPPVW